jgi:hypothetical protein
MILPSYDHGIYNRLSEPISVLQITRSGSPPDEIIRTIEPPRAKFIFAAISARPCPYF